MQFFAVIYFLLGLTTLTIATPVTLISENDRELAARTPLQITPSIAAELEAMSATLSSNNSSTANGPTLKERNKVRITSASINSQPSPITSTNPPNLQADIYCANQIGTYNWPWAEVNTIQRVIPSLQGRRCFVKAHNYAIIGSGGLNAILLYNDNDFDIEPDCGYLGSYAQDIIDYCNGQLNLGKFLNGPDSFRKAWFVVGQRMDTDGYNVVVRGFGANPS
ncbi:hypothetical protein HYFRA_00007402 [Hymenoscyphus fraxineus]|uniref:Ecp2 effector protein domain-containing protein n=1 Tax=Hymenoscyphus fraxineus TaxID=746836 RepID=A0A9N9PLS4_9HELO|nr:hypothetical protein HYFRA_00007402 [Hymenoscyphus fraxineus]